MFLRLYYAISHPSLGFDVSLPDPPSNLPYPLGYVLQLHRTSTEGLDLPTSIHALDKSTWANCLVKEIAFSLINMSVGCTFIDGSQVQWPLEEASRKVLMSVVDDIDHATELTDRPYRHESHVSINKSGEKHKRQKSILKTLLSSLVHPDRSFSSVHRKITTAAASFSSYHSSNTQQSNTNNIDNTKEPLISATYLRKRARTTLVDAFRRFILTHLRSQMPEDGYFSWVAGSMLHRAESRLSVLEANGLTPDLLPSDVIIAFEANVGGPDGSRGCCYLPYEDDEETLSFGDTDTDTDTDDGSSLHTPHESLVDHRDLWEVNEEDEEDEERPDVIGVVVGVDNTNDRKKKMNEMGNRETDSKTPTQKAPIPQAIPRSPTPEPSKEEIEEYTSLHSRCLHLRALLVATEAANRRTTVEHRSMLAVFEVKSKRRAWSARAFLGGARLEDCGLGTPYSSSPLAYCDSVTPESLLREASSASSISPSSPYSSSFRLTPITEMTDDDAYTVVGDMDVDMCAGSCSSESTIDDIFAFSHPYSDTVESSPFSYSSSSSYSSHRYQNHTPESSHLYSPTSEYPRPVARRGDYPSLSSSLSSTAPSSTSTLISGLNREAYFTDRDTLTPIPVHIFGHRHTYDEASSPEPNEFTLAVEMKTLSLGRRGVPI